MTTEPIITGTLHATGDDATMQAFGTVTPPTWLDHLTPDQITDWWERLDNIYDLVSNVVGNIDVHHWVATVQAIFDALRNLIG